jgi:hypothetical protein
MKRLLFIVLLTTFCPVMAVAGQLTNTGSDLPAVFEGHVLSGPADVKSILYAPTEDDSPTFRADLAALTDAVVDYFDPRFETPDAVLLADYDVVMTWVNYAYADSVLMGDNLADFVDSGGKVILGQWCLPTGGSHIKGAIWGPGYCPVTGSSYSSGYYVGDGVDCVHDGVIEYESPYVDDTTLVSGSSDGTFSSGYLAVAWRDDRKVYYSPGNTGGYFSTGDWALLTANMVNCDGGRAPLLVTGPGPAEQNPNLVRLFPPEEDAAHQSEFNAYGPDRYGVNVCCGEVSGGGISSVITGAGPGAVFGPHVRGFAPDGTQLPGLSFLAYGTNKWGVNVAAGDLDGDGIDEIITGAGPGAVFGPHVRGWSYEAGDVSPFPGVSYFAYGTPKWGVNVTAGDIDGDGFDEIVTGAGPGAVYGPHVRGWNVDGDAAAAIPGVSFLAYGTNKFGVNVTCGDVDGDGIDEIVTGAGPGAVFGPHVRGWNYDGDIIAPLPGFSFFAWDTAPLRFGANVFAGADLNSDGRAELVTGRGPDPDADTEVKVFQYDGSQVTELFSLEAFTDMTHGANVAAGRF